MRVENEDDVRRVAWLLGLPEQIIAEAMGLPTEASQLLTKSASFDTLAKACEGLPAGSKTLQDALKRLEVLAILDRSRSEQYVRIITAQREIPRGRPHWFCILDVSHIRFFRVRKAWKFFLTKTTFGTEGGRIALARTISLL